MHFQSHRADWQVWIGAGSLLFAGSEGYFRSLLDGAVLAVRVIYARPSDFHDGFRR